MRCYEFTGKRCYDHLGGKLGAALLEFLVSQKWIERRAGASTTYAVTKAGYEEFAKLGLKLPPPMDKIRRPGNEKCDQQL